MEYKSGGKLPKLDMRKSNINNPNVPSLGSSIVETEENSNILKDPSRIDENA